MRNPSPLKLESITDFVARDNKLCFAGIYAIEIGLRETIIDTMTSSYGSRWWCSRIPRELREAMKDGFAKEKKVNWTKHVLHHPIYYLNFPDIPQLITGNWELFDDHFPKKEFLKSTFEKLYPIRNKVAHSRVLTEYDTLQVESALNEIFANFRQDELLVSIANPTSVIDISTKLLKLREEGETFLGVMRNKSQPVSTPEWNSTEAKWWFAGDYILANLGEYDHLFSTDSDAIPDDDHNFLDSLHTYFNFCTDYQGMSRKRGEGHRIDEWFQKNRIENKWISAVECLDTLLNNTKERNN